jgi:hypothetical protein
MSILINPPDYKTNSKLYIFGLTLHPTSNKQALQIFLGSKLRKMKFKFINRMQYSNHHRIKFHPQIMVKTKLMKVTQASNSRFREEHAVYLSLNKKEPMLKMVKLILMEMAKASLLLQDQLSNILMSLEGTGLLLQRLTS